MKKPAAAPFWPCARAALATALQSWPVTAVVFLTGCASFAGPPADLAQVRLELVDSPLVRVSKAWLERTEGKVVLRGHVLRRPETTDTTSTHLDISFFNRAGDLVKFTQTSFEPRQIRRRHRMPDSADFLLPLNSLPSDTNVIIVRAHEGTHP
jgi:hypothetical protein